MRSLLAAAALASLLVLPQLFAANVLPPAKTPPATQKATPVPVTIPTYPDDLVFAPGKEVKIDDPQTAVGDLELFDTDPPGHIVIYTPSDYDPARAWPVILSYHGQKNPPSAWPFRDLTGGKGYIIIGMEYLRPACYRADPKYETGYIQRLIAYLKGHLNVDTKMVFMGGFSQGGWHVAGNSDRLVDSLAGIIICSAGREAAGPALPGIRGKPVLISAGEKEENRSSAESAVKYYTAQGAEVTFVLFPNGGHAVNTGDPVMKKWFLDNGPARQARLNLAAADKARKDNHLGEAFTLYTGITRNPLAGESKDKAAAAAKEIESEAQAKLDAAEASITARKYPDARKAFTAIAAAYVGAPFADAAKKRLDALDHDPAILADIKQAGIDARADALEANALAAEKGKDYAQAFKLYETYLTSFPTAHRVAEVKAHLDELKANKEFVALAYHQSADRDGKSNLAMANSYIASSKPELAKPLLQEIITKYPDTDWAVKAKTLLDTLK